MDKARWKEKFFSERERERVCSKLECLFYRENFVILSH